MRTNTKKLDGKMESTELQGPSSSWPSPTWDRIFVLKLTVKDVAQAGGNYDEKDGDKCKMKIELLSPSSNKNLAQAAFCRDWSSASPLRCACCSQP